MGIKYSSFAIRGIDVSQFNGVIDWSKVMCEFVAIRVGYGRVFDSRFQSNWKNAKGKVKRIPYWYMDYYSNHISTSPVYDMSDEAWGKEQANNCWNAIKDDPEGIVFLDIESTTGSYAPKIDAVTNRVQNIARAFLVEIDRLSGKKNGMYLPVGWLDWYEDWFRDRPLWVAWYPYRTVQGLDSSDIIYMVEKQGWKVKPIIWQYASDGIINDDGIKAGKTYFKTQLDEMDLNGWVGTVEQYNSLFSTNVEIPDPIETPDDEVIVTPPTNTRVIQIKESTRTLTLRKKPQVSWLTQIRTYPAGTKFDCLEKVTVNGNTWQRVGIDQYIADNYDGIQYLK